MGLSQFVYRLYLSDDLTVRILYSLFPKIQGIYVGLWIWSGRGQKNLWKGHLIVGREQNGTIFGLYLPAAGKTLICPSHVPVSCMRHRVIFGCME